MTPFSDAKRPRRTPDWARYYISQGFQVVPVDPNGKGCKDDDWLHLVFRPEDFRDDDNIGIRSVNGLVIVDLDSPEALACADDFLPPTDMVFGRPSKPRSKRGYLAFQADGRTPAFDKVVAFVDLEDDLKDKKATHVELRGNHQDVVPPSRHSNEVVMWFHPHPRPSTQDATTLRHDVQLVATCAHVMRYYPPPGRRHEFCLALSGTARSCGITEAEMRTIMRSAARYAGDAKIDDRLIEVRTTYARGDDEPVKARGDLRKLAGEMFVKTFVRFWNAERRNHHGFVLDGKGDRVLANDQQNVRHALDKLNVAVSFDEFAQRALIRTADGRTRLLDDAAVIHLWLTIDATFRFRPSKDFFFDFVIHEARSHAVHPVRKYLAGLRWDGHPRIDDWLIRLARAKDTPLTRQASALVLKAAVKRIREPGCKFDELLVLMSTKQGLLKSSALRTLCPNDDWFSDDLPLGVDAKQLIERTLGKWIIEAADLSGMGRRELDTLKSSLSRQIDGPVRLAYDRAATERPRQFIIIGTTNKIQFLKDQTGNRRFWPVAVERFDIDGLRAERDQLWAEAMVRVESGESIRLHKDLYDHAARRQERHQIEDPWTNVLREKFVEPPDETGVRDRILLEDVWTALGIPVERRDERATERVNAIMQALGYIKKQARGADGDNRNMKRWCRIDGQLELDEDAE